MADTVARPTALRNGGAPARREAPPTTPTANGADIETMLREILDRQRQSEARLQSLEATLVPAAVPERGSVPEARPPLTDTLPLAKMETPLSISWNRREVPPLPPLVLPTRNTTRSGGVIPTPPPRRTAPSPPPGGPPQAIIRQNVPAVLPPVPHSEAMRVSLADWAIAPCPDATPHQAPAGRCENAEALLSESEGRRRDSDARVARLEQQVHDLETQLRQARRLETVGRLVAGVAHDFNNLLTLICGNAELLCEGLDAGDANRDAAAQVVAAGHSAAALTRQLLALARPTPAEPRPVDLNGVVRAAETMIRRLMTDQITLTVHLAPTVELVRADPVQVEQVLFNLVTNARDAFATGGGSVVVRTADAVIAPDRPGWPEDLPPGGYVSLTVSDTGCGMSDDVKTRLFVPFFSTKPAGQGTGLGLANVRDVMHRAGGHIELESAVGWGTSVRLYWPKLATFVPATEDDLAVVPVGPKHLGRGETVLLVEDDAAVRDLAKSALQQAGYRVLDAADADAAEERVRLYAGPLGVLVTDVGLPKRDGFQLAAALRETRPELKVLYVSGYAVHQALPTGHNDAFLAKPFTPQRLLETLRHILGCDRQE